MTLMSMGYNVIFNFVCMKLKFLVIYSIPEILFQSLVLETSKNHVSETTRRVETGQEPGTTHDMDDDDIDYVEESETCSDQSN